MYGGTKLYGIILSKMAECFVVGFDRNPYAIAAVIALPGF